MSGRRRVLGLVVAAVVAATTVPIVDRATRPVDDDRYVLLALGSDLGPWRPDSVLTGRSDATHLIVVTPSRGSAVILSFPRDLFVPIPGLGTTRINDALTLGPESSVATIEQLTGIEVDDWIVTGMRAFTQAMDARGGLVVDVPQRLRVDDTTIEPGRRLLEGSEVLVYGRDRKSRIDGDFGRNRAQAEILSLLHEQLVEDGPDVSELLDIVLVLRRHTVSSIPPARLAVLASIALDIDPDRVVRVQVPAVDAVSGGAAVVLPTGAAETLFADLRDDGSITP